MAVSIAPARHAVNRISPATPPAAQRERTFIEEAVAIKTITDLGDSRLSSF
jgi:hypothetical protein